MQFIDCVIRKSSLKVGKRSNRPSGLLFKKADIGRKGRLKSLSDGLWVNRTNGCRQHPSAEKTNAETASG